MKKIKLFIDSIVLAKIEKINPKLYVFLRYTLIGNVLKFSSFFKYGDKYFFNSISIEISSYCNRKCSYCPNKDYPTPKNFMTESIFKEIISQLKKINYTGWIYYHFYNEPLFDDRLEYFVEYVKNNLPKVSQILFTNGDILDMDRAENLIDLGMDKFIITVHGENPDKNIEILKPIEERFKHKVKLQSSKDLYLSNRGGLVDIKGEKTKNTELKKCVNIFSAVVDINGNVLLCCQDYHRKHIMGNILEEDIKTIWKSIRFTKIRNNLLDKNKAELPICRVCLERDDNSK